MLRPGTRSGEAVVDRIIEFFAPYFAQWGYLIVGLATLLENSLGFGLVVPGETLVLLGGFYAGRGDLDAVVVATIAAVGGIAGDNIGYLIGRRAGRPFIVRYGHRVFLKEERIAAAERFYARHGGKTVFLGRFVPVIRSVGSIIAGVGHMRYPRFVVYDLAGSVIWAVGHTVIGYVVGDQYERYKGYLDGFGLVLLGLLVALIAISAWRKRRRDRLRVKAGPAEPPDEEEE